MFKNKYPSVKMAAGQPEFPVSRGFIWRDDFNWKSLMPEAWQGCGLVGGVLNDPVPMHDFLHLFVLDNGNVEAVEISIIGEHHIQLALLHSSSSTGFLCKRLMTADFSF